MRTLGRFVTATRGREALAFGVLALLVYLSNFRVITDGDSFASRYLPFALWKSGSVRLDAVASAATRVPERLQSTSPHWIWTSPQGHVYSLYPIVQPVALAPLYAPAVVYVAWRGWADWRLDHVAVVMEKACAALVAAAAAGLFFFAARRRLPSSRAWLLAAALAFGSSTWAVSSQALWQHGFSEALLASVLVLLTAPGPLPAWRLALAGAACGLLAANRPPCVPAALALLAALAWRHRRLAVPAILAAAAAFAVPAAYNLAVFGNVLGGYGALFPPSHGIWSVPTLEEISGLLVSPAKGLLTFSPLFFALLGWFLPAVRRAGEPGERGLNLALLAGVLSLLTLAASFSWLGGFCYGPRLLADGLPALAWLLVPVVRRMRGAAVVAFVAAVAFSIAVQAIGALCYPGGRSDEAYFALEQRRENDSPAASWSWRNYAPWLELQAGFADPYLLPGRWRPDTSP